MLKVFVDNKEYSIEKGSNLQDLSKLVYKDDYIKYLGARINNTIYNLNKKVIDKSSIEFLDINSKDGYRIYTRTISLVFILACKYCVPETVATIEHFIGEGLYAELGKGFSIGHRELEKIKAKMEEIINKDLPITRKELFYDEAMDFFERQDYQDKIRLYKTLDRKTIHIYKVDDKVFTFHGYLAPSTGYVKDFDLKYYYPGATIMFPSPKSNGKTPQFKEQKALSKVFKETKFWADLLDISYVGALNEKIEAGKIDEIIRVTEAFYEKKLGFIADEIVKDDDISIILIAGPSSSGKTTTAQRLDVHLKVNGKRPIAISVDDYFVDRELTPRDEEGNYDFEVIEAVDLKRLNDDLLQLLEGEEVELPKFNFLTGKSEKSGIKIKVDKDHPIIVEGIHALNPRLTNAIPEKNKYKVYVSALTQLNIDPHNRISTSDVRLIRRIVRDNQFRGHNALKTLELWQKVRKGEEKYIFPFQESADVSLDSALLYELSVLKKHIVPLIEDVGEDSIYHSETKRLLKFLSYFKDIRDESIIPPSSVLREFIGGTGFDIH